MNLDGEIERNVVRSECKTQPEAFEFAGKQELSDEVEALNAPLPGRTLTYTTRDVIDARISVPAQHALVHPSTHPAISAAVRLLEAVKAGRVIGIFCVNCQGRRSVRRVASPAGEAACDRERS